MAQVDGTGKAPDEAAVALYPPVTTPGLFVAQVVDLGGAAFTTQGLRTTTTPGLVVVQGVSSPVPVAPPAVVSLVGVSEPWSEDPYAVFASAARVAPHPLRMMFEEDDSLLCSTLLWEQDESVVAICAFREARLAQIDEWILDIRAADPAASARFRQAALWDHLLHVTGHSDPMVGEMFRSGARILGDMGGPDHWPPAVVPLDADPLWSRAEIIAQDVIARPAFLASIRSSPHDAALWEATMCDVQAGNMVGPFHSVEEVRNCLGGEFVVARRFGVEQSDKVRECDDCRRNNLNRGTNADRKLKLSGLKSLLWAAGVLAKEGEVPFAHFWKRDHRKSYRQVPVNVDDHKLLVVALWNAATASVAFFYHKFLPFGATAAVYAYNRVSCALVHIARSWLRMPVDSYFDDYWGIGEPERAALSFTHFGRLNALLGLDIKEAKDQPPMGEGILLGVQIRVDRWPLRLSVDDERAARLTAKVSAVLKAGVITPGQASSLAGKFNFTMSMAYGAVGRAALAPFYRLQRKAEQPYPLSAEMRESLHFLVALLRNRTPQVFHGASSERPHHVLFTDAAGDTRMAGVLFCEGEDRPIVVAGSCLPEWTACMLPRENQITLWELLAVSLSVRSLRDRLRDSDLSLYVDNEGAKGMILNGFARGDCLDGTVLAADLWAMMAELHIALYVERVPSLDNVADGPTRPEDPHKSAWLNSLSPVSRPMSPLPDEVLAKLRVVQARAAARK